IVTVHDIGQDEPSGTNFIAMEYVEGQNLKEILAQGRPLSFDEIGDIVAQVAEAIDFAHSKGIIHRDVKPANIIVLEGNRATIITRDHEKLPTIEMPFPEAGGGNPHGTMAAAGAGGGVAAVALPQPAAARSVPTPRVKPGDMFRKTLDGVRAMPLWKTTIPSA